MVTVEAIRLARNGDLVEARDLVIEEIARLGGSFGELDAPSGIIMADLDTLEEMLPAQPQVTSSPASGAPSMDERRLRGVHERAMGRILGQKC